MSLDTISIGSASGTQISAAAEGSVCVAWQPGAILVENGTMLPGGISLQPTPLSKSWRCVPELDRTGLDAQLMKSGWTLFYMAGVIQKRAFGFDRDKRMRRAVTRVIEDVQAERCNCVEITDLASKTFLGIPYVSVTAHARHIQDGSQFRGR